VILVFDSLGFHFSKETGMYLGQRQHLIFVLGKFKPMMTYFLTIPGSLADV